MPRLFVAAWPPPDVIQALRGLARPNEPGVRWVPDTNLHITLRFVGDVPADVVAGPLGRTDLPRAVARLGPSISRLGPRQLVIPAAGVDELADVVRAAAAGPDAPDRHRFRGHLTVARTKRGARSAAFGTPFEASWTIDEVALVESDLRPSGAVYATIATFKTV